MCMSNSSIPLVIGGIVSIAAIAASYGTSTPAVAAAWGGVAASAAGAGIAASAQMQQAQTARDAADYNAQVQRDTARSVEQEGAQAASDKKIQAKRFAASQVAAAGAGGVDPSSGTPLTLESQTAEFGELDALRIINNAQRTAWGYQTQGNITEWSGGRAYQAGQLNAGTTLLGAASRSYYGYNQAVGGSSPGGV